MPEKIQKYQLERVFGGIAWLMASVGTFIAAIGYFGMIEDRNWGDWRMIGYALVVYALGAFFVALSRFARTSK